MSKLQFVFTPTSIEVHDAHSDKSRDVVAVITPEELIAILIEMRARLSEMIQPPTTKGTDENQD